MRTRRFDAQKGVAFSTPSGAAALRPTRALRRTRRGAGVRKACGFIEKKAMIALRTGIDLIEINRLASIQPRIRARFMARVYTPQELVEARESYPSLAGKFAAKEAASKALGTGIGPVRWQDFEILHGPQGEPVLHLHGAAQAIANRLGLTTWSVSISHSRSQAVAVVVAMG